MTIVPMMMKADPLFLIGLAETNNDLARTKKPKPEEDAGGTFSITNLGSF